MDDLDMKRKFTTFVPRWARGRAAEEMAELDRLEQKCGMLLAGAPPLIDAHDDLDIPFDETEFEE